MIGPDIIRSTRLTVVTRRENGLTTLEFRGVGWGHGIGLCQWGARGQAIAGHTFEEILKFYYTGVAVERPASRVP